MNSTKAKGEVKSVSSVGRYYSTRRNWRARTQPDQNRRGRAESKYDEGRWKGGRGEVQKGTEKVVRMSDWCES